MKTRELFYLLGFRPAPRTYGSEVIAFDLPREGRIEYARWLHPREDAKIFSQDAVDALRKFLSPGDVAIDIGAHTGDSTLPIALAVGQSGTVLALEPNPYVYPVLTKNAELNRDKATIIALPFAATPQDGDFEFEYGDAGFCNGGIHENVSRWKHGLAFKLKVTGKDLAKYLASRHPDLVSRIRYIKVDAEGYDLTVLTALSELIARCRPFIRAEVFKWTSRAQRERLFQFLQSAGYTVRKFESESNYFGEMLGPERVMDWPHYDIFAVPQGSAVPTSEPAKDTASRR